MLTKQEAQPRKDVVRNERQPGESERAIASLQQDTEGLMPENEPDKLVKEDNSE